ncbi:MAG: serine protease [Hyphomonadaceae bacterium]
MSLHKMRAWTAGALLSTALMTSLSGLAPAVAQDKPVQDQSLDSVMATLEPEFYCVFDVLSQSGGFQDIATAWVASDADQADVDAAEAVLSKAVKECADSYDWPKEVQAFGATVGIHGSVVQVVTDEMMTAGLKEAQLQGVFDILGDLDEEDTKAFVDESWIEDHAFKKKMYRALVRFGLPNEDEALENSMLVLRSSVMTADAIAKWMDAKMVDVSATAGAEIPAPRPSNKSNKSAKAAPRPPKLELAATGTGWYVAPGGYLVTNAHVVADCKMVTLKGGAELQVLDVQPDEDLALLKGAIEVAPLSLRDGRSARLAEDVLVAGYPLGGILSSGINVTVGTVSALAGMGDDVRRFQFTAPVQPGNSGGPVLDTSGHVIGVVVSKLNAMNIQDQIGDIPQNVNFGIALPSLIDFLKGNNVPYAPKASSEHIDKVDLAELARESTVLLQCYQ